MLDGLGQLRHLGFSGNDKKHVLVLLRVPADRFQRSHSPMQFRHHIVRHLFIFLRKHEHLYGRLASEQNEIKHERECNHGKITINHVLESLARNQQYRSDDEDIRIKIYLSWRDRPELVQHQCRDVRTSGTAATLENQSYADSLQQTSDNRYQCPVVNVQEIPRYRRNPVKFRQNLEQDR